MRILAPVLAIVLLAAAAEVCVAPLPAARAEIADRLDQTAPEIACASWAAGQPTQLAKLRGRVVVLHFSDPDGIASKAALATLRKLSNAWKDAPVTIVEVVLSPTESSALGYAAKELPPWAVGWDGRGASAAQYPGTSVPRTYLIGPEGRVVWHAHVGALTKEMVSAQVDRVKFVAPSPEVKKAKAAAKAAAEQRFGAALAEAAKVEADPAATDADRAICAAIRADVDRTWDLQKKVLDALVKENDWAIAWRRADRMRRIFAGTPREADANAEVAKLDERPIVPYVRAAQDLFEKILDDVPKAKSRKDLEALIDRCRNFETKYDTTRPGERAAALRESLEKRLSEMGAK